VIFSHGADVAGIGSATAMLAGRETAATGEKAELKTCPVACLSEGPFGVGLAPLDDVFIIQSRGWFGEGRLVIGSSEFALDAGDSCTLEWAVYVTPTAGHYAMVNALRRDEGRNNVTVEGGFAMVPGSMSRRSLELSPSKAFIEQRNARYVSLACLSWSTDDPGVSLEGIEFIRYPKERAAVASLMGAIHGTSPESYGMFHVAPNLYATNRPEELWPDSRLIQADGTQSVYPYNYDGCHYFTRERHEDNWRWWIYYPTLDNSFGKDLLASVDVMMDEMGCRGVFVDGYFCGYGGEYTYDRWDGRSAEIDPSTGMIERKKGSVLLLSQAAIVEYTRRVIARGGVVVANNTVITRTIGRLPIITDKEITEGPYVHTAPSPCVLGNPTVIQGERDVYFDALNKLRAGNLYFYYGEPATLSRESLPAEQYPITVQAIHSGWIEGRERQVTMLSGVYGWAGSRDIHVIHRFDALGRRAADASVCTADGMSVRSEIELGANESAVIQRLGVQLLCDRPVNYRAEAGEPGGVTVRLRGAGAVTLVDERGEAHSVLLEPGREQVVSLPWGEGPTEVGMFVE